MTATAQDLPRLRELYRSASLTNERDAPNLLAHPEFLEFAGDGIAAGRTLVAVTNDGTLVGFATDVPAGEFSELEDLFVDPDWMRRGVARALVDDLVGRARSAGIERIEVTANEHALAFYEAVGFVVTGQERTEFGDAPRMMLAVT